MLYLRENKAEQHNENYKILTDWTARIEFPDLRRMNMVLAYAISWNNLNLLGVTITVY